MGYSKLMNVFSSGSQKKMVTGLIGALGARSILKNAPKTTTTYPNGINKRKSKSTRSSKKKQKMTVKRSKPVTLNTVKRMMATQSEAKVKDANINATLTNGDVFSYNLTAQIVQGTADGTRVGDEIYLKTLELRGFVAAHTVSGAYSYRVIVGWSGEELNPATLATGGLTFGQIFMPNLGAATSAFGVINKKAFTAISDRFYDVNSQIAGIVDLSTALTTPKCVGKFKFQANGSQFGKTRNLYVIVIGFLQGAAAAATCGSTNMNYAIKYTDS